jgi:hypothetical protein
LLSGVGHFQKSAILFTSILLRPAEDPRAADASKTDERDIKDGKLFVQQGKAGAKRRIEIIGELVIGAKNCIPQGFQMRRFTGEGCDGQGGNQQAIFVQRAINRKHTIVGMTEQYIRMRKGMKVTPTK